MGDIFRREFSTGSVNTGTPYDPSKMLQPGQTIHYGTNQTQTPDVQVGPYNLPGAPAAQLTVARPSFLSAFLQNLGPSLAGSLQAPRGSGVAGGLAGGFAGIDNYQHQRLLEQFQQQQMQTTQDSLKLHAADINSQIALRAAQTNAFDLKPEDKPIQGSEFTDQAGQRRVAVQGPDGNIRTVVLGMAQDKPDTSAQVKQSFMSTVQKALQSAPPGFDANSLVDPKQMRTFITASKALTPAEKAAAISYTLNNPEHSAMAGNLFYQAASGDPQAKAALALETQQKQEVARAGAGGGVAALAGVAPHLVPAATADATKAGQEYVVANQAAMDIKSFVDLARGGNVLSYAYLPTEGVLTLNTSRGVKRVNLPEIQSYGGAGSAADRIMGFFGKQMSGASIPENVLADMAAVHQQVAKNAKSAYGNHLKVVNANYGSKFQPVDVNATSADPAGLFNK